MARRARKKRDFSRFWLVLRIILVVGAALAAAYFTGVKGIAAVKTSPVFRVKSVDLSPSLQFIDPAQLARLVGRSMFDIDLPGVQRRIQARYPEIDQPRIIRRFPNRIYVTARKREPFAAMSARRQELVLDDRGVVLSFDGSADAGLPRIDGVEIFSDAVLGKPVRRREVAVALTVLKALRDNAQTSRYGVSSVDVSNLSMINVSLSNRVKVIIDRDDIGRKIRTLGILLTDGNLDFNSINYIDLRFREPILGEKAG